MADTKISALSAGSALGGTEQIPAVQSGGNVYLTPEQITAALVHPGHVAGNWYSAGYGRLANAGGAPGANQIVLSPLMVSRRITISDLGCRIQTTSAGGNIRLGIWASSASTRKPTGAALSSTTVSTTSAATVSGTLGANVSLTPGLYWLGAQFDNGTAVAQGCSIDTLGGAAFLVGSSTVAGLCGGSAAIFNGYSAAATYASGAPDLTSASFTEMDSAAAPACVFFKVTSVP